MDNCYGQVSARLELSLTVTITVTVPKQSVLWQFCSAHEYSLGVKDVKDELKMRTNTHVKNAVPSIFPEKPVHGEISVAASSKPKHEVGRRTLAAKLEKTRVRRVERSMNQLNSHCFN